MENSFCQIPAMPASCQIQQQISWLQEIEAIEALSGLSESDKTRLAAIIINSSHLHRMAKLFAADIPDIFTGKAEDILKKAGEEWQEAMKTASTDDGLAKDLRAFRNRCHFAIALSELCQKMDIGTACSRLSECAEIGLQGVVDYLLASGTASADTEIASARWVILGLGKLGAGELNYSSDIDVIVLHQFAPNSSEESYDKQSRHFIGLTRRLAKILSEDTRDGFGWRVDFRLRPDPAATPLSLSYAAAVSYYESTARSWERAAFIRARPVAGDIALGQQFLTAISAFIWRRSFDYTVIDDLQIWLRHLAPAPGYYGFDVKLGQFGIRHIELLVHILQLLGGGRHPELRCHNTCTALDRLVGLEWLDADQAAALKHSYFKWREIEHRVQYLRDTQTHKLPRDANGMADFSAFCGFAAAEDLVSAIQDLQSATQNAAHHPIFDKMVENARTRQAEMAEPLASAADYELSLDWLASLGFLRPHDIRDIIDGWDSGRTPATRGERARQYLFRLLPELLANFAKAGDPDAAFAHFADFVAALPAGAQAFSLLCQHPQLASLITDILVKAPALTNTIGRHTDILDIFLEPHFFTPLEGIEALAASCPELQQDEPVELYLDRVKRWSHEARFRANVHMLQKITPVSEVSACLSAIAEISVQAVSRAAIQDFQSRYGRIENSHLYIVALGKLGCQTMTARSDIDLLFIYDGTADTQSDGPRALGISAYYIRLTQLIISWLTVASREASLYEIDTRLRPDGKSGPAATHISRIEAYYEKEAWPWEHIAFAKARQIFASDNAPIAELNKKIARLHSSLPALGNMKTDIVKMRDKLRREQTGQKPSGLGLKKRPGGFLDIEFLAMLLRMQGGHSGKTASPAAPLAVLQAWNIDKGEADIQHSIEAAMLLEEIQAFSQLCLPRYTESPDTENPAPAYQALAEITGYGQLEKLLDAIETAADTIEGSLLKRLENL